MTMAVPALQAVLFLSILFLCPSSYKSDSPASSAPSSPSSAGHRHRHQHHHRHHHGDHQQASGGKAVREKDVSDDDTALGVVQSLEGGQAEEAGDEQHGVRETVPAGNERTQPAAPLVGVPVGADDESPPGAGHADALPQSSDLREETAGRPEQRPNGDQLTAVPPPPNPQPASNSSTPSRESQQADVADQSDGLRSTTDKKHPDTITPGQVKGLSGHPQKDHDDDDDDDVNDDNKSQDSAFLETSAGSSDEKLVNRPRWRHILRQNGEDDSKDDESETNHDPPLIKGNSSRNRPKDNKVEPEVESDPPADPLSGPTPDSDPDPKRWSLNRPRWEVSRQTAEESHSTSLPTPMKPNESDVHSNNGTKEEKATNKPKNRRKGQKREPVELVQQEVKVKRKRKIKKKNKQLPKGCPGCTPTEMKLAEARELHKEVLKAQLLDKLRLVPIFPRQPWPPKLPNQVLPEEAQRDQAPYEDRYYARPTQLLLFGRDVGPRHRLKKAGTGSYKFGVRGKVKGGVRSARLWVYKMKDSRDVHGQTLVVMELQMTKRRRLRERSLVARRDTRVQEGWVSFDVTRLVRRWVESETPASLQLLAIRCKTCHRTNYRAIFGVKSHFRPVLEIRESEKRQRHREERSPCDPNNGCCKFDMVVSFEELGIHEIFRPLAIKADYCFGTCERPDAYHYNHTMIVQHMRFNSHFQNTTLRHRLQPCCVPVVLREATIYHYLNSGLDTQVSLVPNLLVDRCGCA